MNLHELAQRTKAARERRLQETNQEFQKLTAVLIRERQLRAEQKQADIDAAIAEAEKIILAAADNGQNIADVFLMADFFPGLFQLDGKKGISEANWDVYNALVVHFKSQQFLVKEGSYDLLGKSGFPVRVISVVWNLTD